MDGAIVLVQLVERNNLPAFGADEVFCPQMIRAYHSALHREYVRVDLGTVVLPLSVTGVTCSA